MNGIRVNALEGCHGLIAWIKVRGVNVADVAACGRYFDPVSCEIKGVLPSRRKRVMWWSCSFIMFVVSMFIGSMFAINAMLSDHVLVRLKEIDQYLLLAA